MLAATPLMSGRSRVTLPPAATTAAGALGPPTTTSPEGFGWGAGGGPAGGGGAGPPADHAHGGMRRGGGGGPGGDGAARHRDGDERRQCCGEEATKMAHVSLVGRYRRSLNVLLVTADRYTHGHQDAVLRSHRWRTAQNSAAYLLPHLRPGMNLLDVGCGPGTLTLDLAQRVAPGRVVGVDVEPAVIEEASRLAEERKSDNLDFRVGDFRDAAASLTSRSFDVVHAHQVLQHLRDPVGA